MKKIYLSGRKQTGKYTLVENNDYEELSKYKWHYNGGYAARTENGRVIFMHRIINNTPDNFLTDHINRNRLDNRRCNLRTCTNSQNRMNSIKHNDKSTVYKGVTFHREHRWLARISLNGKIIYLGVFNTPEEGALAYNNKAIEIFGEFAVLNTLQINK